MPSQERREADVDVSVPLGEGAYPPELLGEAPVEEEGSTKTRTSPPRARIRPTAALSGGLAGAVSAQERQPFRTGDLQA